MLRDRDGENLREHLIATAARLIDARAGTGLRIRKTCWRTHCWRTSAG